jgi:hypothetical protein
MCHAKAWTANTQNVNRSLVRRRTDFTLPQNQQDFLTFSLRFYNCWDSLAINLQPQSYVI